MASGALLLSSCAEFDDTASDQNWKQAGELTPQAGPEPELPEAGGSRPPNGGEQEAPQSVPPPQGCTDYDPAVVQTCLDTVSTVAALPSDGSAAGALAGERKSGRVLQVAAEAEPVELATLEVDASGDGGLTGLALSPSYAEDQLVFAYVTTASDNRVVRFAKGQEPKPVLTGIPKGATGNSGALTADGKGALLVATGDAGDAAAADDPASLAGKVLRIDSAGQPAKGNPTEGSAVLTTGLHSPGGLCKAPDGSRLWVTDRGPAKDALFRIEPGKPLATPAWTWPDRPGVAGCTDWADVVMVAASTAGNIQNLPIAQDGAITGKPSTSADGDSGATYGRLAGMDMITAEMGVASTVNKDGGEPVSSDDRVVLIVRQGGKGGGKD